MKSTFNRTGSRLLAGAATIALSTVALSTPAHAIVPNDNYTPDDIVDNDEDFSGVGMFFRNDGFVCSGTLINPRTVLFAAHCVNDVAETDFATMRSGRRGHSTSMRCRAFRTGSATPSQAIPISRSSTSTASITIRGRSRVPTAKAS